ncbi:MAG: preprotein translocase subunit SecE [Anaerovoracaceae bacterium]|jgi:preprotein translocase subunit SecE
MARAKAKANAGVNPKGKDVKKRVTPPKREKRNLKEYFKGVRIEMKKVVWPTRKELGAYTAVVFVTCAFFALAFWAIDSGFLAILKGLLGIKM